MAVLENRYETGTNYDSRLAVYTPVSSILPWTCMGVRLRVLR